nr:hypothetical protein [Tanacetum cinerariifolium]
MSTQQDIYAVGSESHPPMLNKENYMPWSSRLLRYAKSIPNGKLIHNSIINCSYVRCMIPEPGDTNREVLVNETFYIQTDDELTENELKRIEADDQAIQTILLGLPEDIYAAVHSCKTAQEIWLRVQQMMKGSDIGIQEKKAKLFYEWERFTSNEGESIESYYHHELKAKRLAKTQYPLALMANSNNPYNFPAPHQDQPSFNQNYMQQPMPNPKDITDPTTAMNMAFALMAKAFKLNYSTPTNNNQRISSNLRNRQIAQPGMNMGQDRQIQMVGGYGENQFRQYAGQNVGNLNGYNAIQNVGNQVAQNPTHAERNAVGQDGNQIRCYNCRGVADLDEIEEVNANCILMANLQQASTLGTQFNKALVYDSDGSVEYTELLEPIPEQYQVPQNDNYVISEVTSVEQSGKTVEQHPVNFEETQKLQLAQESREKMKQLDKEIKPANYTKINHLSGVFVSQTAKSREELYFSNDSKTANVSKTISIPNEEFSDDTTPSVAADESLAKHKTLELEIERLLRAVVSQDIMFVVQKTFVVDTSNLQTELERTKVRFENCIIKKENEYAKLWNDWYKKCDECKFDKISYDKTYKDMQQKIEWLQAQLGDLKGKSKDTSCVSDTLNPLSQKLENENVSVQKDNTCGTSKNTKFSKQSILGKPPMLDEIHALLKPVTSNPVPTPQESKVMKNAKVIASGMFRINPFKTSWEEKHVPNNVRASARTKPITVSQPPVITKKDVNSDSNGLSSTGIDNTKTRRPQPRSNTKKNIKI